MHTMYSGEYTPPTLTVDSVVFQLVDGELSVLLIERANEPFAGWWALPGGYCSAGETTRQAMARVLADKAGVGCNDLGFVEQLYTFDTVARDPRGHAVSVTYMGVGRDLSPEQGAHCQNPRFYPLSSLPNLAYDHRDIITYAHDRLKSKLKHTNGAFALMSEKFTLSELQSAYESVLDTPLDKRNFRKKIASFDMLEELDEMKRTGAHRPARLYKFKSRRLQNFTGDFN